MPLPEMPSTVSRQSTSNYRPLFMSNLDFAKRSEPFQFIMFTRERHMAAAANREGIDFVGPDLEVLGKDDRQSDQIYRISRHTLDDLSNVYEVIDCDRRFVRCNPINRDSEKEIEEVISRGAAAIMLPYFKSFEEAEEFTKLVAGRAKAILLVETRGAVSNLEKILSKLSIDRIHIGLNDLAIDTCSKNRFVLLCSEWMQEICAISRRFETPFGFGGIARIVNNEIPVSPNLVYAQYARLGARCAVIARSFTHGLSPDQFGGELAKARNRIEYWFSQDRESLDEAHAELLSKSKNWNEPR